MRNYVKEWKRSIKPTGTCFFLSFKKSFISMLTHIWREPEVMIITADIFLSFTVPLFSSNTYRYDARQRERKWSKRIFMCGWKTYVHRHCHLCASKVIVSDDDNVVIAAALYWCAFLFHLDNKKYHDSMAQLRK
mgnify:CR=1 FL=1